MASTISRRSRSKVTLAYIYRRCTRPPGRQVAPLRLPGTHSNERVSWPYNLRATQIVQRSLLFTWSRRNRYIRANHGGGYALRLCKKEGKGSCTEEADFLKLPYLEFVSTKLRWQDGTEENITGTYITEGTFPKGSMWAMNPLPESPTADFPPPCKSGVEPKVRAPMALGKYGYNPGRCAGNWPTTVNIVDTIRIPSDTAPGEYVLSWRWDCEQTAQVWNACRYA